MSNKIGPPTRSGGHLIAGPGGARAILAATGMLMALDYFGFRSFASLGGVSGGAIPVRLFAAGVSVRRLVELAVELDFQSLLDSEATMKSVMFEHYYLHASRYRNRLPISGCYNGKRFAKWIEDAADPSWPEKFWTLACDHDAQILLSKEGVFRREKGGKFHQLCSQTPRLGTAICASCAVPMIFNSVPLTLGGGEVLTLHDGALSWEGWQPVSVVVDHLAAEPRDIIVCDVGPDTTLYDRISSSIWKVVCGGRCIPTSKVVAESERKFLLIKPVVTSVCTFEFTASKDNKIEAIMEGFAATLRALAQDNRLTEAEYLAGRDIVVSFNGMVRAARRQEPGTLSQQAMSLLVSKGVLSESNK